MTNEELLAYAKENYSEGTLVQSLGCRGAGCGKKERTNGGHIQMYRGGHVGQYGMKGFLYDADKKIWAEKIYKETEFMVFN